MSTADQNTAATAGKVSLASDLSAPDAPNGGGTALKRPHHEFGRSGSIQKGDPDLIGVAPHQLGPQFHALLAHQNIEPAWQDRRASD